MHNLLLETRYSERIHSHGVLDSNLHRVSTKHIQLVAQPSLLGVSNGLDYRVLVCRRGERAHLFYSHLSCADIRRLARRLSESADR